MLRGAGKILAQSEDAGYEAALALAIGGRTSDRLGIIFHGHRWWTRRRRAFAGIIRRMKNVRLLCLSESLRKLAIAEYGLPADRVHAPGYGVDSRFFQPMTAHGPPCIVSAGTASRDYRCLVEASDGLRVEVHIAADSTWYRERLNTDGMKLPVNVHICQTGNYENLKRLYSRSLFLTVPLLDVRFACGYAVVAEGMAMGKAVIATRTGTPSDLIAHGVTGLYVPPGDVGALRTAMVSLLEDEGLAQRMGSAGREAVERHLNLEAYVGRLAKSMELE